MGFWKDLSDMAGEVVGGVAKVGGDLVEGAAEVAGDLAEGAAEVVGGAAEVVGEVIGGAANIGSQVVEKTIYGAGVAIGVATYITVEGARYLTDGTVRGFDIATDAIIPNKNFMKQEVKALKEAGNRYNLHVEGTQVKALELHELRANKGRNIINRVESYINTLANTPKKLNKAIADYASEYRTFDHTVDEISRQVEETNEAFGKTSGSGALAGVGVAAIAPSAAMAFATTFGTASTGAAISSLSGAAATNAALAWLGGGAAAAGGGGMAAGNTLLALAGPIGWGIGGIALVGSGFMMNKKCLENANEAIKARKEIEVNAANLKLTKGKISEHFKLTESHIKGIKTLLNELKESAPRDYAMFNNDQKLQVGSLVNHITALSGLLNQTIT